MSPEYTHATTRVDCAFPRYDNGISQNQGFVLALYTPGIRSPTMGRARPSRRRIQGCSPAPTLLSAPDSQQALWQVHDVPPRRQATEAHPGDTGLLGLGTGPEGRRHRTTRCSKCSGLSLQYSGHGVTSASPTKSDLDVTLQEGGGASGMRHSEE